MHIHIYIQNWLERSYGMINKNQYDNGIRCKGMCDFGNSDKGQGFIGGGCAEREFCYQYKMKHQFGSDILYKNIIFNGVKYICKLLYSFFSLCNYYRKPVLKSIKHL